MCLPHKWWNVVMLIATLTLVFMMWLLVWRKWICWTFFAAASLFGSSMVPEPGLSLRIVLFGVQCDKPGVNISTSGQCLFQSQMDNTVKAIRKSWRGSSNTSDYKAGYGKHCWPQRTSIPNEILWSCNTRPVNGIYHGLLCLPITIKYSVCGIRKPEIFSATFTVVHSFMHITMDEQQANWIFAQFGRTHSDKVQWFSPMFGKQLACDCGQSMCHAELDELICELVTSGAMTNEGWEFSAAPSGGNSIPDCSGAPSRMLPQHRRFAMEHNQLGRNPGQCFARKCSPFQCRCFWNMLPDDSVLSQSFKQAGWDVGVVAGYQSQSRFQLAKPFLSQLVQSQQRVKGYWIWIQSQSTATSVWAQGDVQYLLQDAHRIVKSTCLDGVLWSQNNEIVSYHCSILSLEGICPHKSHSGMSPSVNFWTFMASSSWQRFSYNLAGVWKGAQHMTLERSSVHLASMLSPPGQSFEQFLHRTHFLPSDARPISNVARRMGSVIQPVRRAVPQLIPERLAALLRHLCAKWLQELLHGNSEVHLQLNHG